MKFPVSPATGQQFTPSESHPTYVWNGAAWKAYSNVIGSGATGPIGPTGPAGLAGENSFFYRDTPPTEGLHNGAMWYNTGTLDTFAYVYDGEDYHWVQING